MHGSGGDTEGGIGAGGEVFCLMQFLTSIDHGGCCHPKADMRPHSRCGSIQQSADMLGIRLVSLKLETAYQALPHLFYWDFALDLSGNRSGAPILCSQHPLKVESDENRFITCKSSTN